MGIAEDSDVMGFIDDAWEALKTGSYDQDEFWAAVLVLVVAAVVLLCCCFGCFRCRKHCMQQKLNRKLNEDVEADADALWEQAGYTKPVDARANIGVESWPPKHNSKRWSEASYAASIASASEAGYRAHAYHPGKAAQAYAPYDNTDRGVFENYKQKGTQKQERGLSDDYRRQQAAGYRTVQAASHDGFGDYAQAPEYHVEAIREPGDRVAADAEPYLGRGSSRATSSAIGATPPVAAVARSPSGHRRSGSRSESKRRQTIQEPLMISPRKHHSSSGGEDGLPSLDTANAPPIVSRREGTFRPPPPPGHAAAARAAAAGATKGQPPRSRGGNNPPGFLNMMTPALESTGASNYSVSQGFKLEAEMMMGEGGTEQMSRRSSMHSAASGDVAESGGGVVAAGGTAPAATARTEARRPPTLGIDIDGTVVPDAVGHRAPADVATLTRHLGLASIQNAHPQILERSPAAGEVLATALWDAGVRFWLLKRRSPGQYTIIRRFHNLSSPYIKEAADIDADGDAAGQQHALLEQAITVQGTEEAIYIDIAMQSGVLLDILLDGAGANGACAGWVRLALAEGSVVLLPYATTYRLRMPGRGCVGLLRARME